MTEVDAQPVSHRGRQLLAMAMAFGLTVPALAVRITGEHPSDVVATAIFGLAVVGAAFLLAWGAEALQVDISQGLSLAVLALIAVLPEYAVDFTFAAKAGADPDKFAPLALANMTGGNRLLIGIGWPLVVFVAAYRLRSTARARGYQGPVDTEVRLDRSHTVDIAFLTIATLYSLTLPLKSHITLWDAAILVLLYVAYAIRISRAPASEPHLVGPAELLGSLPKVRRRALVGGILGFAALVIILSADPFAESLVSTGSELGIDTFLLVQWLAPLASESPELIVAALFAWRLNTNGGLGTLVSSKVNQWTLLVGSLPIVFLVAGGAASGLPIDALQREELFLTAAQSVFAVSVLISRSITVREAWALLILFLGQFILGGILPESVREWERLGVAIMYLVLATGVLWVQRRNIAPTMRDGLLTPVKEMVHERESDPQPIADR